MLYLNIIALVAGIWAVANGILHDIFVLKEHKGPYTRDLLRLLMDGHILLTCGVVYLLAYVLLNHNNITGIYLCITASLSLLIYCGMIFPFLKSMVTILINLTVLVVALIKLVGLNF